jgi:hypothetical protein
MTEERSMNKLTIVIEACAVLFFAIACGGLEIFLPNWQMVLSAEGNYRTNISIDDSRKTQDKHIRNINDDLRYGAVDGRKPFFLHKVHLGNCIGKVNLQFRLDGELVYSGDYIIKTSEMELDLMPFIPMEKLTPGHHELIVKIVSSPASKTSCTHYSIIPFEITNNRR